MMGGSNLIAGLVVVQVVVYANADDSFRAGRNLGNDVVVGACAWVGGCRWERRKVA